MSTLIEVPRRVVHSVFHTLGGPATTWATTVARRRVLVLALVAALGLAPAVGWLTGSWVAVAVMWAAILLLAVQVSASTRWRFDRATRTLDERERHERNAVFKQPYFTGLAVGIVGTAVVTVLLEDPAEPASLATAVAVWMAMFLVPTVVLAWTLPDEVVDGQ